MKNCSNDEVQRNRGGVQTLFEINYARAILSRVGLIIKGENILKTGDERDLILEIK